MTSSVVSRLSTTFRVLSRTLPWADTQTPVRKRLLTSSQLTRKTSADTPWIIGSMLVFGPALLYLMYPSKKPEASHQNLHSKPEINSTPTPTEENENSEARSVSEMRIGDAREAQLTTSLDADETSSIN